MDGRVWNEHSKQRISMATREVIGSVTRLKRVFVNLFGNKFRLVKSTTGYVLSPLSRHLKSGKDHHVTAILKEDAIRQAALSFRQPIVMSVVGRYGRIGIAP